MNIYQINKTFDEIYKESLENQNNDKALDILFDFIDDLLTDGKFSEVNDLFLLFDFNKLNEDLLIGILVITNIKPRETLPNRKVFFEKVEQYLINNNISNIGKLLQNLE